MSERGPVSYYVLYLAPLGCQICEQRLHSCGEQATGCEHLLKQCRRLALTCKRAMENMKSELPEGW
eukprot:scaffold177466_cov43-Prasinocladus_malaysianus.AAC.1